MAAHSQYLASLDDVARKSLEQRLLDRQSDRCFICDDLIDLVLHAGQLDVDGMQIFYYNASSGLMTKAEYKSNAWQFSPDIPYNIDMGKSYWVKIASGKTVSLLGSVISTPFSKALLGNKFSTLGSALPKTLTLSNAGLTPRGTDQIFLFDNDTKLMGKLKSSGGQWKNAVPGEPIFDLIPGRGYWYRNEDIDLNWTLNP